MRTRNKKGLNCFPIMILLILSCLAIEGSDPRRMRCSLFSLGVNDGYFQHLGETITTFYGEENRLLFVLAVDNSSDAQELRVEQVPKSIRFDHLSALRFHLDSTKSEVQITCSPYQAAVTLKAIGLLARTEDPIRRDAYFSFQGDGSFPVSLKPKESLYLLLALETKEALPPDDYELFATIELEKETPESRGVWFRTRRVTDDDSKAQYQKMKADRYRLYDQADQERKTLKSLVRIAPGSALSWYYLGRYLEDTGNYEEALKIYREGLARFPCPVEKTGRDTMLSSEPQPEMVKEGAAWLFRRPCMQQAVANMMKVLKRSE